MRTSVLIRNLSGNVSNKEIEAFLTNNKTYSYEHISLSKTNKTAMVSPVRLKIIISFLDYLCRSFRSNQLARQARLLDASVRGVNYIVSCFEILINRFRSLAKRNRSSGAIKQMFQQNHDYPDEKVHLTFNDYLIMIF